MFEDTEKEIDDAMVPPGCEGDLWDSRYEEELLEELTGLTEEFRE